MTVQPTSSAFAGSTGASGSSNTTASSSGGGGLQAIPPEGDADYTQLLSDLASNQAARTAAESLRVPGSAAYKLSYDYQVMKRLYAQTKSPDDLNTLGQARNALMAWITASFPAGSQTLAQRALGVEPLPVPLAQSLSIGAPPAGLVPAPSDVTTVTDAQLKEMTAEQAKAWTSSNLQALADRVNLLSLDVLTSLSPDQMKGIKLSALNLDQLRVFSPTQLGGLQASQITELIGGPAIVATDVAIEKLQTLLGSDIAALPLSAIPALKLQCLHQTQLEGLTKGQMGQVTAGQMNALAASRWPELGADVTGLKPEILKDLAADKVNGLSVTQVGLLGAELANFQPDALSRLLSSAEKVEALSDAALSALIRRRKDLLVTVPVPGATGPTILQMVPPETISRVSATDIATLGLQPLTEAQCQKLKPEQLAELTALHARNSSNVDLVTSSQLRALGSAAAGLPASFLRNLSVTQAEGLKNQTSIQALDSQVASLSTAVLNAWFASNPAVHQHMTAAGVSALMVIRPDLYVNSSDGTGKTTRTALDSAKLVLLSPAAINSVGLNAFSPQQRQNQLKPEQFALLSFATAKDKISAQSLKELGTKVSGFPPDAVRGLPVDVAKTLTTAQITALDGKVASLPMAALTSLLSVSANVGALTAAGVSALLARDKDLLFARIGGTDRVLTHVRPEAIGGLSGDEIKSLGLKALTEGQFDALTDTQLAALRPEDVRSSSPPEDLLSKARIDRLGRRVDCLKEECFSVFSKEQAEGLDGEQLEVLNFKVAALSATALTEVILCDAGKLRSVQSGATQLLLLNRLSMFYDLNARPSRNFLANLNDYHVQRLTAENFRTLTPVVRHLARISSTTGTLTFRTEVLPGVKLSELQDAHLRAMTDVQLGLVTAEQISAMTGAQVALWGTRITLLSDAALKALSARHANGVTQAQVDALFKAGKIPILNQEFVNGLGSKLPQDLSTGDPLKMALSWLGDPSKLADSGIEDLTAEEIAMWSAEQIAALGTRLQLVPVRVLEKLGPAQLARVQLRNMSDRQLIALTALQLSGLTQPTQVEGMTIRQLEKLGADILSLPDAVIAGIDLMMLNRLSLIRLANAKAGVFTVAQVGALTADRFRVIGKAIANLSNRALEALTGDQVRTLFPHQVQALDGKLGLLTPEAFGAICKDPRRVRNITVRGAESLRPDHLAVAPLHWFSLEALSVLTPAQLAEVTPAQLEKLSPQQRAALPPGTFD